MRTTSGIVSSKVLTPAAGEKSIRLPIFSLFLTLIITTLSGASNKIDPKTYLMWQDIPENKGVILTWDEAKAYCEALDQDGFDDWWLPSESELSTIVDLDRPEGRKIQRGFRHYKPGAYWTESTYAWNAPDAWVISFRDGSSYTEKKEGRRFFRCVRCSDFQECITRFYQKY